MLFDVVKELNLWIEGSPVCFSLFCMIFTFKFFIHHFFLLVNLAMDI